MAKYKKKEPVEEVKEPVEEVIEIPAATSIPEVSGELKRIKVSHDQLMKLQAEGRLVGWDPSKNEALIK